jgi:chromate transporter
MILFRLFMVFSKIGFFAFGGAYSFLPLLEREVVQTHHWLDKPEFLEVLGITRMFPGAISIKFATYTGYHVAGVPGAVVANVANLLAPILFIMLASLLYSKYKDIPFVKAGLEMVQYTVFAMIIAVAVRLVDVSQVFQFKSLLVIAAAFSLCTFTKIHPALIIMGAGVFGAILR